MSTSSGDGWQLPAEYKLLRAAGEELPALDLLTQAGLCLGFACQRLDGSVSDHRCLAVSVLSCMGLRASRAVALLIAGGYSSEAFPQCRRLMEMAVHADHIYADESGQRAAAWLDGRGAKAARLMGQENWKLVSPGSHADSRHLPFMTTSEPETTIHILCCRDPRDELIALWAACTTLDLSETVHLAADLDQEGVRFLRESIDARLEDMPLAA